MSETSRRCGARLVPVDPGNLREAWRASPFDTWLQLAEAVGTSHVRLNKLRDGKTASCHREFAERLAAALDVTVEWLTGEEDHLPFARTPVWAVDGAPEWPEARRLEVANVVESRFGRRCYDALIRDLTPRYGSREAAEKAFYDDQWWMVFESAFLALIRPGQWQARLFPTRRLQKAPRGRVRLARRHEDAMNHLARGFEIVLEPWLSGRADLDLAVLTWIVGLRTEHVQRLRDLSDSRRSRKGARRKRR